MYIIMICLLTVFFVTHVFAQSSALIDIRDIMHSRYKENEVKGSLKKFPE